MKKHNYELCNCQNYGCTVEVSSHAELPSLSIAWQGPTGPPSENGKKNPGRFMAAGGLGKRRAGVHKSPVCPGSAAHLGYSVQTAFHRGCQNSVHSQMSPKTPAESFYILTRCSQVWRTGGGFSFHDQLEMSGRETLTLCSIMRSEFEMTSASLLPALCSAQCHVYIAI